MYNPSTAAQNLLYRSHSIDTRVTVFHPVLGNMQVPISGGSVTCDLTSKVRRTAELQVDPRLWPKQPFDLLSPFGSYAFIEYGIVVPRVRTEWVPLGTLFLDSSGRQRPFSGDASVALKLVDGSARVAEDTFDAPQQTVSGATAVTEITRLIHRTLPDVTVTVSAAVVDRVVPRLEMQADPWSDGVLVLADAIQAQVAFNRYGNVEILPVPTVDDLPVWYVRTGDNGNVISTNEQLSRDRVFTRVMASGQRADSIPPVSGSATNNDPLSPTRHGGPFGRKTFRYVSAAFTTTAQCNDYAAVKLKQVGALAFNIDFEMLTHPGLNAGDVIRLTDAELGDGSHLVEKVTIPMTPANAQPIITRSDDMPTAA